MPNDDSDTLFFVSGKSDFLDNVVGEGIDLAKKGSELSDGEVIQETGVNIVYIFEIVNDLVHDNTLFCNDQPKLYS